MEINGIRGGEEYESLDKETLTNYKGEEVGEISQLSSVILHSGELENIEEEGLEKLRGMPEEEVLERIRASAEHFSSEVNGKGFEEYCENVSRLTGLPISDIRNAAEMMAGGMKNIEVTVRAQLPDSDLELLNNYSENSNYVLTPRGKSLGVVPPSNHPAVNSVWVTGTAMKYPTMVRPANEEPLTSKRVIESLQKAGIPGEALSYLPGGREFANELLNSSDLGIIFGSDRTISRYEENDDIVTYGPGNSKIYVDEEYPDEEAALDIAKQAMIKDGGKGCINVSEIVTDGDAEEFARKLAEEVSNYKVKDPLNEDAVIPAMPKGQAERFNSYVEEGLEDAKDLTHPDGKGRLVERNGAGFIRPTVIYIEDNPEGHDLFTELPFQYSSVAGYEEGILDDTLTLTMLTEDEEKVQEALDNPNIEKVYVGVPSTEIDLRQPHEGYLSDFLFKKKAYKTDGKLGGEEESISYLDRLKKLLAS